MPPMTVKKQYLAIKGHNSSPKAQLCYLDTSLKECYQRIKREKKKQGNNLFIIDLIT